MNEKELYKQKLQTQLDTWKADIAKLKAKVSAAKTDAQIMMDKQVIALERRLEDTQDKLAKAIEDERDSRKEVVQSDWDSVNSAINDVASRFKN